MTITKRKAPLTARPAPIWVAVLIMVPWLSLAGCSAREAVSAPPEPPAVAVTAAAVRTVQPTLETHGTVMHSAIVEVFPTVEAVVERIDVEVGDWVTAGDRLATLDTRRIELALDQARSGLDARHAMRELAREQVVAGRREVETQMIRIAKIERELAQRKREYETVRDMVNRRQQLHVVGGVTDAELDAVRTQYERIRTDREQVAGDLAMLSVGYRDDDIAAAGFPVPTSPQERLERLIAIHTAPLHARLEVAEAELRSAELETVALSRTRDETVIRAPVSGRISSRGLDAGSLARPQSALFSVMTVDPVIVVAQVSEHRVGDVRTGAEVTIVIGRNHERSIAGTISLVSPRVDTSSRSARIQVTAANPDGSLIPGMFATVRIVLGPPVSAIILPDQAVRTDRSETVYVVRDGLLQRVGVRSLETPGGERAVVGPISAGELIATQPQPWFRDGIAVTAVRDGRL
ncbi:MAG: efflux RND transporter periplasmic adaptor subunit [Spirochaetaceae bacterium]|nr:MAG: efflux RND transporter periplasmic adaptor subunit [Spirochaetaceae bacterium]